MKRNVSLFAFIVLSFIGLISFTGEGENSQPTGLTVDFLANADRVFLNGYQVNTPLYQAVGRRENFQFAEIERKKPFFGWIVNSGRNNTFQTAYRILVASTPENIAADKGDCWDTEKVNSEQSVNILYNGSDLKPNTVYFWKVKTWDNHGVESSFSQIRQFKTAPELKDYATSRYPVQKQDVYPALVKQIDKSAWFIDFGKTAFGQLRISLFGNSETDTVTIHFGENMKDGRVSRSPGGTIRYSKYKLALKPGWNTYKIALTPDKRNTGPQAVLMPAYIGEVTPFRYCELEGYSGTLDKNQLVQEIAFYPFNESQSYFTSSDTVLNHVWDLCKYSIKATSFLGMYVDGDRERIPYEADAVINQLSHYGVDREYSIGRYTYEYLLHKPTWPTEWIMQSVLMAWNDYLYTGNKESLQQFYTDLKAKALLPLADESGLISTRTGKVTPAVLESIHFNGNLRDIVDWPQSGILGLGKKEPGETDGFVFQDVNTVVNAYHYKALTALQQIAKVLGQTSDEQMFVQKAAKVKQSFNEKLLDKNKGIYVDGIGTDHSSLHANMFPLAFGLVPEKNVDKVNSFVQSRGMACSVYGSQFLLDAIYNGNNSEYGLGLLASTAERSWYNMIRVGSTISLEAWDNKYKPNQDWNHAWGAAPANLIPRKLMGIEPLEPGFRRMIIKPQPASLKHAEIVCPTIRGNVLMSFVNEPGKSFSMKVEMPANTTADVYLPWYPKSKVTMDGQVVKGKQAGKYWVIEGIGSGKHEFGVMVN